MALEESDQLVVLGGRESRLQGEGADGCSQPAEIARSRHVELGSLVTRPCREQRTEELDSFARKREQSRSPVREYCTPGSVRGAGR